MIVVVSDVGYLFIKFGNLDSLLFSVLTALLLTRPNFLLLLEF